MAEQAASIRIKQASNLAAIVTPPAGTFSLTLVGGNLILTDEAGTHRTIRTKCIPFGQYSCHKGVGNTGSADEENDWAQGVYHLNTGPYAEFYGQFVTMRYEGGTWVPKNGIPA
jgi:hypothetical protein